MALPAAAIAQDAGSNQYQDPLAGEPGGGGGSGGGGGGGGGNSGGGGGGGGNAPAEGAGTQGVQNQSGSPSTRSAQAGDQLPATGVEAWLLVLGGLGLLTTGVGLRGLVGRPSL